MMKMTGTGEVFLADLAQDVHLLQLENEKITVNSANLLAFDADIDWDIERVKGASGMMGGGLFNTALKGSGYVAVVSDGPPVMLDVGQRADVRRRPGRDHVVRGRVDLDPHGLQGDQEPDRPRLGRDDPDGVQRAPAGCSCSPARGASTARSAAAGAAAECSGTSSTADRLVAPRFIR